MRQACRVPKLSAVVSDPRRGEQGLGAAVTLRNVAITHNRVAPTDGEEFSGDEGVVVSSLKPAAGSTAGATSRSITPW